MILKLGRRPALRASACWTCVGQCARVVLPPTVIYYSFHTISEALRASLSESNNKKRVMRLSVSEPRKAW